MANIMGGGSSGDVVQMDDITVKWMTDQLANGGLSPELTKRYTDQLARASGGSQTGSTWDIDRAIPGLPGLTKSATNIIQSALDGLPSPSESRLENAWFGAGSGLDPTSEFLRNRGYDLYGKKAEQRQRGGIQDLLSLVGGYSGTVAPTPGEQIGQRTASANRAQQAAQFNATMGFEREQYNKSLELLQQYLGNPAGGTGTFYNGRYI